MEALQWLAERLGVKAGDSPAVQCRSRSYSVNLPEHSSDAQQFERMAAEMRRGLPPSQLKRMATLLGLPADPLERLGVGWSRAEQAASWPMRDGNGNVIGIRLRCPSTAQKWAVKGSKNALFFQPCGILQASAERLYVCEGPTDTAALISLGLAAVGVPSAGGGREHLAKLCHRVRPPEIVIVADGDKPGVAGAERLAESLVSIAGVRIISPPNGTKDSRDWVAGGADKTTIEAACTAVAKRSLTIKRV